MALISTEFSVIEGYLMQRSVTDPAGTMQFWSCVTPMCPGKAQKSCGRKDHQPTEAHNHSAEQLKARLIDVSGADSYPFDLIWTALADGESIPKLITTNSSGLILEWRRVMTKRKQGAATEFYRCTACEVNNIYKGEKLPHLYVDVTKPNTRVLLTDPETIRHVCCETTYIPMNFSKTNSLLPSASYPEEDANHRPNVSVDSMNLSLFNHNSQNNLQEPSTSREPSEPAAKKPKLEDRFDQSEDIWTDFGVMVASMTRRTAQKNLDKAFRLQQGIFKFLHDFEGGR